MNQIRELLISRAKELAAHDGAPVSTLYVHAAADSMIKEILRERNAALDEPNKSSISAISPVAPPPSVPVSRPAPAPPAAPIPPKPAAPASPAATANGKKQ